MHLPIEHESVLTIVVAPKRPFRRRRLGKESIEIFLQRHIHWPDKILLLKASEMFSTTYNYFEIMDFHGQ